MTAIETLTAPPVTRRTALNRTLWVVQILLALMYGVASAAPKLLGEDTTVESFAQIGPGAWFRYLVGAMELAGGIGLLIPRLSRAAAVGLLGLMIGATYTQLVILDSPVLALTPVVLIAVLGFVVWGRRPQTGSES